MECLKITLMVTTSVLDLVWPRGSDNLKIYIFYLLPKLKILARARAFIANNIEIQVLKTRLLECQTLNRRKLFSIRTLTFGLCYWWEVTHSNIHSIYHIYSTCVNLYFSILRKRLKTEGPGKRWKSTDNAISRTQTWCNMTPIHIKLIK